MEILMFILSALGVFLGGYLLGTVMSIITMRRKAERGETVEFKDCSIQLKYTKKT